MEFRDYGGSNFIFMYTDNILVLASTRRNQCQQGDNILDSEN